MDCPGGRDLCGGRFFGDKAFDDADVYIIDKIYVLSKQNSEAMSYNDLQMSTQLAEDCAALIKSRTVTSEVIKIWSLT